MKNLKQLLGVVTLVALFGLLSTTVTAQSNNNLIGKAKGELATCMAQYQGPDYTIDGYIAIVDCFTQPCPVAYLVTLVACPTCNPNNPNDLCSRRPCISIGNVEFDDQGNVVGSNSICD